MIKIVSNLLFSTNKRLTRRIFEWNLINDKRLLITSSKEFAKFDNLSKLTKENLNVGTIGHVDHGKTTLTAAITRFLSNKGKTKFVPFDQIDKGVEERRRGITINLAHIGYETENRRFAHTDCPGHIDFIKNMITGTAQIDVAILVVAATDGVMAQTKEHVLLAHQIGVTRIIAFINKVDLVDTDTVTLVEIEILELLEEYGYKSDSIWIVKGSALQALDAGRTECVEELLKVLDEIPLPQRQQEGKLLMPIGSRVVVRGRGTVAVGTIERGILRKGDKVEIKGAEGSFEAKALDIQVFGRSIESAVAGDHCGVLCKGVKLSNINRGMWLGEPGSITLSNFIKAELYLLSEKENGRRTAIRSGFTDKIYCTTWDQIGRFDIEGEFLMPGEYATVHIGLNGFVPVEVSRPFTIRDSQTNSTIAQGIIKGVLPALDTETKLGLKVLHNEVKRLKNVT